ncbi:MAG: alpha/beta hydrolase [Deltaproteobacteria bacterium]|nr:alpha/beta hydrolase [Deltaproteobacteria bacterium]
MPILELPDATLHVDDAGDGPALVLLHGFTGTAADWSVLFDLPALRRAFRVIAIDQRGHGRSTARWPITYAACARDVLAVLDHLGIARCAAIGQSLGAKTLLHLATLAPDRVDAMILAGAAPRVPDATRALMAQIANAPLEAATRDALATRHRADQLDAMWRQPATFAADRTDLAFTAADLAAITARTLIVHGDRDELYPVELAVELYRAIPRASLWVIPDAGHDAIFTAARDGFAARATAFLFDRSAPSRTTVPISSKREAPLAEPPNLRRLS